jgi:Zn-dependent alcohol dehydrogenase
MAPLLMKEYSLGRLPLDKVTTSYNVDEFQRAFDDVESGKTVKAVLTW